MDNANKTPTTLSPRARRAVEILTAGGYWRKALETGYNGREQFAYRLIDANGAIVKGYSAKAFWETKEAGLLVSRPCAVSSRWPQEWTIAV